MKRNQLHTVCLNEHAVMCSSMCLNVEHFQKSLNVQMLSLVSLQLSLSLSVCEVLIKTFSCRPLTAAERSDPSPPGRRRRRWLDNWAERVIVREGEKNTRRTITAVKKETVIIIYCWSARVIIPADGLKRVCDD